MEGNVYEYFLRFVEVCVLEGDIYCSVIISVKKYCVGCKVHVEPRLMYENKAKNIGMDVLYKLYTVARLLLIYLYGYTHTYVYTKHVFTLLIVCYYLKQ